MATHSVHSFDENYALASTQSLKNKDIPEGGAKGTILPSYAELGDWGSIVLNTLQVGREP